MMLVFRSDLGQTKNSNCTLNESCPKMASVILGTCSNGHFSHHFGFKSIFDSIKNRVKRHDAARSLLCRLWFQMTPTVWDGSSCILEILASHRPSFLDSLWSRHTWVCTDMEVDGNITIPPRPQAGNYSYWWFDLFYLLGAKTGKYGLADQNEDGGGPCSCWEYLYKPAPGCFLWKMSVSEKYDGDVRHESVKGSACSLALTQPGCHRN